MLKSNVCTFFHLLLQFSVLTVIAAKREKAERLFHQSLDNTGEEETVFSPEESKISRQGKYFALFNVVQFNNGGCTSQITQTVNGVTSNRAGVCYTASECSSNGGTASGNCASGFGVCCVFIVTGSSGTATVTQNCTYLQNVGFPSSAVPSPNTIKYTINKCNNGVCALRLDFQTFTTLGPALTTETMTGGACQDTLTMMPSGTSTNAPALPVICGQNSGQHVYLPLCNTDGANAMVTFNFVTSTSTRAWDIKVTQVKCGTDTPPDGCFQYFTSASGDIKSFNFDASPESTILQNQNYQACVRPCKGFCCIEYIPCPGVPDAFSINSIPPIDQGLVDAACAPSDYVMISGAQAECSNCRQAAQVSRICGSHFGPLNGLNFGGTVRGGTPTPVCDCSPPFGVSIVTDNMPEVGSMTMISRGVCLQYMQLPCC